MCKVLPRLGGHLHDTGPKLTPAKATSRREGERQGQGWRKEGRERGWWEGQGKWEGILLLFVTIILILTTSATIKSDAISGRLHRCVC